MCNILHVSYYCRIFASEKETNNNLKTGGQRVTAAQGYENYQQQYNKRPP